MSLNKVTVVTITFNNFEELVATLDSTKNSITITNLVINGGSCTKTKDFLDQSQFTHICEKDNGISDAFNKGIKNANGNYIAFLNSGDLLIDPTYYDEALKIFEAYPEIDYIYADITLKHQIYGELNVRPNIGDFSKIPFPHPSLIVKKKVIENIGGFDEKFKIAMDFDFMLRIIINKYKGYYYSIRTVVYMDGTGVSSNNGEKGICEREDILKKYDLMTPEIENYFKNLRFKMKIRAILSRLKLLSFYDNLKSKLAKPQAE